jgi:Flp pilus assembly protein TadD
LSRSRDQPQQAAQAADAAAALAPASPAARIAQSYALQLGLRLEEARAALLAAAPPDDPLVQARLAEVEFYLGHIGAARHAAERAIAAAPALSRPRSILGFVELAQYRFSAAEDAYRAAAKLDPADPLPRLGLGLTAIRRGDVAKGTGEIEIAVALDPARSLLRSYLGKAYAADWRYEPAFREWRLARQLDPKDPTPWLYQALAERWLNRPGDALHDLQKSIELNDNRAVYRSRLLLDEDLATRSTDLAGIYRDLGFDQAAVVQGYKSVDTDPSSRSAHRFLSETLFGLPGHETASDSELLQSLLLQPLDTNPPPPRLARQVIGVLPLFEPTRIGYNEFSPLFASDGLGLPADGFAGNLGTTGGTFWPMDCIATCRGALASSIRAPTAFTRMAISACGSPMLSSSRPSSIRQVCSPSIAIPISMPAILRTASTSQISVRSNANQTPTGNIAWADISMWPPV